MREVADVITQWVSMNNPALGSVIVSEIQLVDGVRRTEDITAQSGNAIIPDPNWHIRRVWADTSVMDAIAADDRFDIIPGTRMPA